MLIQNVRDFIGHRLIRWLTKPRRTSSGALDDFHKMSAHIAPCDVLLVEGQSHLSGIIQMVTHSRWSHAAICVGKPKDFIDALPDNFDYGQLDNDTTYLVETELGIGTVLSPIDTYQDYLTRVLRPYGLSRKDGYNVVAYVISKLGLAYSVRQLTDFARFFFPYGVLPQAWRPGLFAHNAGAETEVVCSSLISQAFQEVEYPILPFVTVDNNGRAVMFQRNPKIFAPSDFDISPYFEVLKFPSVTWSVFSSYHKLPWSDPKIYEAEVLKEIEKQERGG